MGRIPHSLAPLRLCYVLLSPTFGMYQVAADLANRFCDEYDVHLVCATSVPRDRFAAAVHLHPLSKARSSGMDLATLDLLTLLRVMRRISALRPDVVHFVAPHIWNLPLVLWLRVKKNAACLYAP